MNINRINSSPAMCRAAGPQNVAVRGEHERSKSGESGFTLIETVIAQIIILIALLGVFYTFTYAILYNAGNDSRAQALAVLQQEVENLRSKKFTPTITDSDLTGGVKATKTVTAANNFSYSVDVTVDNDPSTPDVVDDEAAVPNTAIKEIQVTVRLAAPNPGWQSAVPATVILRRVRGN